MIEEKIAKREILRLAGLNYFPRLDLPLKELISALQAAATDAIAVFVINEWLAYQTQCPKPADLRRLVWQENEKQPIPGPKPEEAMTLKERLRLWRSQMSPKELAERDERFRQAGFDGE